MRCWVSIGSNQHRERSIRGAIQVLRKRFGKIILSPVYESEAVGFDGRPFYNLVAGFDADVSVGDITRSLRDFEDAFGRVRGPEKFSPRTLDLDLLTYGDLTGTVDGCKLPRDEIVRYAFVLRPLAEVAGEELHPLVARSYRDLWLEFDPATQPLKPVVMDLSASVHQGCGTR